MFLLHRELLKLILVNKPLVSEVVLSQLVIRASLRQYTRHLNNNYVISEDRLAHISTIAVS
jgi:hypothetical protein